MRRLILLTITGLFLAACGETESSVTRLPASSEQPQVYPLIHGDVDRHVGWAIVSNTETSLEVSMLANPGYRLSFASVCASAGPFDFVAPDLCPDVQALAETRSASFSIPFEKVTTETGPGLCESSLFLQLGADAVETASGLAIGASFAGAFKGRVAFPVSCTPEPAFRGCVTEAALWSKDSSWPVPELVLGGKTYGTAELGALLAADPRSDASLHLAHELIAARLNVAAGAEPPAEVSQAIDEADRWLSANADADGRLPFGIKATEVSLPNDPDWDAAVNHAAVPQRFNVGSHGPARCR